MEKKCIPELPFPIYLFKDFDPKKKEPIEIQLCEFLEKAGLIAFHEHNRESAAWSSLFNIFFFKALDLDLQSLSPLGFFRTNRKEKKIREIFVKFRTKSLENFFTEQWDLILNHYCPSFRDNSIIFHNKNPRSKIRMDYSKKRYVNTSSYILDPKFLVPVDKLISAGQKNRYSGQLASCKEKFSKLLQSPDCPDTLKQLELESKFRSDAIKNMIFYPAAYRYHVYSFLTFNVEFLEEKLAKGSPSNILTNELLFDFCGQVGPALAISSWWQSYLPKQFFIDFLGCINQESIIKLLWHFFADILQNNFRLDLKKEIFPSWCGIPDLIVFDKSAREHILLECKSRHDKFRETQKRWFKKNSEYYGFNAGLILTDERSISKYRMNF